MKRKSYVLVVVLSVILGIIFATLPTKTSNVKLGQDGNICLGMAIYPEPEDASQTGFPFTNKLEFAGGCGQSEYNELFYDKLVYDFAVGAAIILVPGLYYLNNRSKKQQ